MPDKPLSIGIGIDFAEAIQAAERRGVVLPEVYYGELQGLARQLAFSIAGIAAHDQLAAAKESLDAAITEGGTFQQWRKNVDVQALELPKHRLDNIFRTNIQSNYARGHWQKYQQTKRTTPYLMYDAINDARVRHSHLALDGVIRPVDDQFWDTHAPLNGYRCRCTLIALTEKQALARSSAGKGLGKAETDDMRPDAGWNYNPGREPFAGVDAAIDRIAGSDGDPHMKYLTESLIKNERDLARWAAFDGRDIEEYRQEIRANLRKIADESSVYMRVNKVSAEELVKTGAMQVSAGDMQAREWSYWRAEYRRSFEASVLGADSGDGVTLGYLADDDAGAMKNLTLNLTHGDIGIKLKVGVKERSSVIGGDIVSSLNSRGSIARGFDKIDERVLQFTAPGKSKSPTTIDRASFSEISYLQANIFGGVSLDDVDRFIFTAQPTKKLAKLLDDAGVSWSVLDPHETTVVFDDILQF